MDAAEGAGKCHQRGRLGRTPHLVVAPPLERRNVRVLDALQVPLAKVGQQVALYD
jgi:hypothetical protein